MEDIDNWLRLGHCTKLGLQTSHRLLETFGTAGAIFRATEDALTKGGFSAQCIAAIRALNPKQLQNITQRAEEWLKADCNQILTFHDPQYPAQLKAIPDPPLILYTSGQSALLRLPSIAIVGSRKATPPALKLTSELSAELCRSGLGITSGLAIGIDRWAHQAALAVDGCTIAVAATGLDRVYPAQHRELAGQIRSSGVLVSEFPLGTSPKPYHFPRRNRIISGLSLGVLVIEAAIKSGTLTTARHAAEQGRTVMAVPGSVYNPLTKGCHHLISEGATLIQCADDILAEIGPQIDTDPLITAGSSPTGQPATQPTDPISIELVGCMGYEPASIDMLVNQTGHTPSEIANGLLKLELDGHIVSVGAGRYIRC